MHPEVIPGWPLHSYGLMLAVGFYAAYFVARRMARKEGLDPKHLLDILLLAAALGIVGSRVFYVVQYSDRVDGFLDMFAIWKGGLVFYGGVIAAVIGLAVYVRVKKLPAWRVADAAAPALMVGVMFGRLGCFLNGCCWGAVCDEQYPLAVRFPRLVASSSAGGCTGRVTHDVAVERDGRWHIKIIRGVPSRVQTRRELGTYLKSHPEAWREVGVQWSRATEAADGTIERETITGSSAFLQHLLEHPDEIGPDDTRSLPVYPTQLYSSSFALVICVVLLLWRRWRRRPGELILLMACLYAVARFINEGLRDDTSPVLGPLTIAQTISVAVFVLGLAAFAWRRFRRADASLAGEKQ